MQGPIADIGSLFDNTKFSESFRGKGYRLINGTHQQTTTTTTEDVTTVFFDYVRPLEK